ncbi:MAG: (2Fe-2S)-binding protein [Deltaproteobacteria bacterium]|nr:(2Fe-2S)-binding protein [Deltaproteobacteria bacterium]
MNYPLKLNVNGEPFELEVSAHRTLLEVLRNDLGLRGTKEGCGAGECGACTVLLDGDPVNSCLVLALQADGRRVTTIEGIAREGNLHPIQEAFIEHGAIQCGFCTPGIILSAKALLERNPNPDEREVREAIVGNFCRCTGYQKIVEAVLALKKNR